MLSSQQNDEQNNIVLEILHTKEYQSATNPKHVSYTQIVDMVRDLLSKG